MQWRNSAGGYGAVSQSLHWITVVLVLIAWALGIFEDAMPKGEVRATGLFIHVTAGVAILFMLMVRLLWRVVDPPPSPVPTVFGAWGDRASRFAHCALYVLLVAVPAIGIAVQFARAKSLPLFGLTEIASPWIANRPLARSMKEVHEILANALVMLAGLHAAAALIHHWVLRDRTLTRMLPGGGR